MPQPAKNDEILMVFIVSMRPFDGELNGWSKRGVGPAPHDQFAVELDKQFTLSAKQGATNKREQPKISIDVLRPGQPSERIWYHDGTPGYVSQMEYENKFGNH